eukprot:g5503.t1
MKTFIAIPSIAQPLYLSTAIVELRQFGIFEEVLNRIKELPSGVPALLQQVLNRLERACGKKVTSNVLSIIESSRNGVTESELLDLLGISQREWIQIHYWLKPFIMPPDEEGSALIRFKSREMNYAVRKRYLTTVSAVQSVHARMADFYLSVCSNFRRNIDCGESASIDVIAAAVKEQSCVWKGESPAQKRALWCLPYHAMHAGQLKRLRCILKDLGYIETMVRANMLFDYQDSVSNAVELHMLLDENGQPYKELARQASHLRSFMNFAHQWSHILPSHPLLLFQQAANYPNRSPVYSAAQARLTEGLEHRSWWQWCNKLNTKAACLCTLSGHEAAVLAVHYSTDGSMIASASSDCTVKVWAAGKRLGTVIATFQAHKGAATCCRFHPTKNDLLLSCSMDGTLRLWHVHDGTCIVAMTYDGQYQTEAQLQIRAKRQAESLSHGTEFGIIDDPLIGVLCCAWSLNGERLVSGDTDGLLQVWDTQLLLENEENYKVEELLIPIRRISAHRGPVSSCDFGCNSLIAYSSSKVGGTLKVWRLNDAKVVMTRVGECMSVSLKKIENSDKNEKEVVVVMRNSKMDLKVSIVNESLIPLNTLQERESRGLKKPIAFTRSTHLSRHSSKNKKRQKENSRKEEEEEEEGEFVRRGILERSTRNDSVRFVRDSDLYTGYNTSLHAHASFTSRNTAKKDFEKQKSNQENEKLTSAKDLGISMKELRDRKKKEEKLRKKVSIRGRDGARLVDDRAHLTLHSSVSPKQEMENPNRASVANSCKDGALRLFAGQTGRLVAELHGHTMAVLASCWSPDGKYLVSCSEDCTLRVWQPHVHNAKPPFSGSVKSLTLAPNAAGGGRLLAWSSAHELQLWNLDKTEHSLVNQRIALDSVRSSSKPLFSWFPGSGPYYFMSVAHALLVWNSKNTVQRPKPPKRDKALDARDDLYDDMAAEETKSNMKENVKKRKKRNDKNQYCEKIDIKYSHRLMTTGQCTVMAVSPTQSYVVTAYAANGQTNSGGIRQGGDIELYDAKTVPKPVVGEDGMLTAAPTVLPVLVKGHSFPPRHAVFTDDGRVFITASTEEVILWDLKLCFDISSKQNKAAAIAELKVAGVRHLSLSPCNQLLICIIHGCIFQMWRLKNVCIMTREGASPTDIARQCMSNIYGHESSVCKVAWDPSGKFLASMEEQGGIRIWRRPSGDKSQLRFIRELRGHSGSPILLQFSADGLRLYSASAQDLSLRCWSLFTGALISMVPLGAGICSAAASAWGVRDLDSVVFGDSAGRLRIYRHRMPSAKSASSSLNNLELIVTEPFVIPRRVCSISRAGVVRWEKTYKAQCPSCGTFAEVKCKGPLVELLHGQHHARQVDVNVPSYLSNSDNLIVCRGYRCGCRMRLAPLVVDNPLGLDGAKYANMDIVREALLASQKVRLMNRAKSKRTAADTATTGVNETRFSLPLKSGGIPMDRHTVHALACEDRLDGNKDEHDDAPLTIDNYHILVQEQEMLHIQLRAKMKAKSDAKAKTNLARARKQIAAKKALGGFGGKISRSGSKAERAAFAALESLVKGSRKFKTFLTKRNSTDVNDDVTMKEDVQEKEQIRSEQDDKNDERKNNENFKFPAHFFPRIANFGRICIAENDDEEEVSGWYGGVLELRNLSTRALRWRVREIKQTKGSSKNVLSVYTQTDHHLAPGLNAFFELQIHAVECGKVAWDMMVELKSGPVTNDVVQIHLHINANVITKADQAVLEKERIRSQNAVGEVKLDVDEENMATLDVVTLGSALHCPLIPIPLAKVHLHPRDTARKFKNEKKYRREKQRLKKRTIGNRTYGLLANARPTHWKEVPEMPGISVPPIPKGFT